MTDEPIDIDDLQAAIEKDFVCARCGHCCKGDGVVRFGAAEAEAMARLLAMPRRKFLKTYAIQAGRGEWWLRDKMVRTAHAHAPEEKWCVFLEIMADGLHGCRLQDAKPRQCGVFPARWRNGDSLKTCLGLRRLISRMNGK